MTEEFFSVSQLNTLIQDVIQAGFPQAVWVCGEIQGYDRQKSKNHIFFQLVEKDADTSQQKATIDLVIWSGKKALIKEILDAAADDFELRDDIEVKFLCRVDFYPPHGRVRLAVESIDAFFTLGKLAQERQKLIEKLTKEGVLQKNKQLEFPLAALHIGLITSDDSAAYNDFIAELNRSGYGFKIFLRNSLMQGKRAEADVCCALDDLQRIHGLDVIVITRGGGSISDLSCFDSELIARQIAACALPVLCGIGHEINTTVADLAAHTRAKTPTAVAQFLVARLDELLGRFNDMFKRLSDAGLKHLAQGKERLRADALNLQAVTHRYLKQHNYALVRFLEKIRLHALEKIRQERAVVRSKNDSILKLPVRRLGSERERLNGYARTVQAFHPHNTLKRGFTITRDEEGKAIKDIKNVRNNSEITTELIGGKLISDVREIRKGKS